MRSTKQENKEIHRLSFSPSRLANEPEESPSESPLDLLPSARPGEPAWPSSGRGSLIESVTTSLWAWLVVGILSAWFSIWLVEAISRLGSRLP